MPASWKQYLGHSEDGVADLETALRLDPHSGGVPWRQLSCAAPTTCSGAGSGRSNRCDKASPPMRRFRAHRPRRRQRMGRARQASERCGGENLQGPSRYRRRFPEDQTTDDPEYLQVQWARIVEGLRKAGLPDELPDVSPTTPAHGTWRSKRSRWSSLNTPTTRRPTGPLVCTRCFSAAAKRASPTSKGRFD